MKLRDDEIDRIRLVRLSALHPSSFFEDSHDVSQLHI